MAEKARLIEVSGTYRREIAYLDLETYKVPCAWWSPAGEFLGRRWSAFMAGVTLADGRIAILSDGLRMLTGEGDEPGFLRRISEVIDGRPVTYRATRKFDEMILKGRYTYARRGPAPEPFYYAMPGAEGLTWNCERPDPTGFWENVRERELDSARVSETFASDSALVAVHLLRDVCELIGAYGEPDDECARWLVEVLRDEEAAFAALYGEGWGETMGFVAP